MTRVASQYGAVNLSQGFPDFAPPVEITNRLAEVAHTGPHQYAITWALRISAKLWPESRIIFPAFPMTRTAKSQSPAEAQKL